MDEVNVVPAEFKTSVGPGAFEDKGISPRPQLEGASADEYVEIFNPLSVTFIGKVGITRPVNAPMTVIQTPGISTMTRNESEVRTNYGLDLKNPNHQGKTNIVQQVTLESGKITRLSGNVASVIVGQLITEMMGREGKKLLLADLHARSEYEKRVIRGRGFLSELLGRQPLTVEQQLTEALKEDIKEASSGEFPELDQTPATDRDVVESERRSPGRPKKSLAS